MVDASPVLASCKHCSAVLLNVDHIGGTVGELDRALAQCEANDIYEPADLDSIARCAPRPYAPRSRLQVCAEGGHACTCACMRMQVCLRLPAKFAYARAHNACHTHTRMRMTMHSVPMSVVVWSSRHHLHPPHGVTSPVRPLPRALKWAG